MKQEGGHGAEDLAVEKEKPKHGKDEMAGDVVVKEVLKFEEGKENVAEKVSPSNKGELI